MHRKNRQSRLSESNDGLCVKRRDQTRGARTGQRSAGRGRGRQGLETRRGSRYGAGSWSPERRGGPPRCQPIFPRSISRPKRTSARRSTPEARLEAVREMFRLLPKHKGTEKLQSDLKQKMSRLREEAERGKAGAKKAGVSHRVPSEGAGQVVLVGRAERGEEQPAGGPDQCPAGGRALSVHDPGAAAGDHDAAGRAGAARRPAADRAGLLRDLGAERDPIGGRRAARGGPGQRRRGGCGPGRPGPAGRGRTPNWWASCPTTWRTSGSATSGR